MLPLRKTILAQEERETLNGNGDTHEKNKSKKKKTFMQISEQFLHVRDLCRYYLFTLVVVCSPTCTINYNLRCST